MADKIDRAEFERATDEFCEQFLAMLRPGIPPEIALQAIAWGDSLPTDEAFQYARMEHANEVDDFIRRLPHHATHGDAWQASEESPVAVVALAMDRLESLPMLVKTMPHKHKPGGSVGDFVELWLIAGWREWFAAGWKEVHGTDPWGSAP